MENEEEKAKKKGEPQSASHGPCPESSVESVDSSSVGTWASVVIDLNHVWPIFSGPFSSRDFCLRGVAFKIVCLLWGSILWTLLDTQTPHSIWSRQEPVSKDRRTDRQRHGAWVGFLWVKLNCWQPMLLVLLLLLLLCCRITTRKATAQGTWVPVCPRRQYISYNM